MRTAWCLTAMLLMAASAPAAVTLYPEPSGWGMLDVGPTLADRRAEIDTLALIAAQMPEGFGPDLRVRLIEDRIGHGTQVIALKQVGAEYRIQSAWSSAWLKLARRVHISRCSVAVDSKIAEDITAAWTGVLLATSYGERPAFGSNGPIDHFAMSLGGRWLAGWAYAPQAETAPGRLRAVAQAMLTLCQRDDVPNHTQLQTALAEALKR